jgi:selenide,water dikinase
MTMTGEVREERLIRNNSARPGDLIILTKPLGTGIIASAVKQDRVDNKALQLAVDSMSALNQKASQIMLECDVHAATDISGFGWACP